MSENTIRLPVLWALGKKGYMVQCPLVTALSENNQVLVLTSSVNVHLYAFAKRYQLLLGIDIPSNITSVFKFLLNWFSTRNKIIIQLSERASIIHVVMCSPWDIFFLSAARKTKIPVVITIHDAKQHLGEESFLMDILRNWIISKADHIVVLSNHVAQLLKQNSHFNKPIIVVDEGLVMRVEPALRARQYPTGRPLKLLFHGRIHAYKGLNLLLDAMRLLQKDSYQCSLTIAGAGDLAPYLVKLEKLNHVSIENRFLPDAELLQILAAHDVLVLPYVEASQSAVAVNALWAALPSIATPVGALPQQLKHGIDALIVDEISAQALATAISNLCNNKQLYEKLSQGAYNSYQSAGPIKAASQWMNLYNNMAI